MSRYNKPLKWSSPEELSLRIEEYFEDVEKNKEIPTVSGLAFWLGTNRQTLLDYENCDTNGLLKRCDATAKQGYIDAIKGAKAFIESRYEQALFNKNSAVGSIFTLKNNYKWVDKQEIETTNKDIKVELTD